MNRIQFPSSVALCAAALCCWSLVSISRVVAETPVNDPAALDPAIAEDETLLRGMKLYSEKCASCHGDKGEGVADFYPAPLTGDSSIGELAEVIDATMPEGEPGECAGEDAEAVSAYVHYAFYSEAAQIRNRPPRIGLARLTGEQLRQSLADLYSRVDGLPWREEKRGLQGIYFTEARWRDSNKKIERVDPVIDFDFGHEGPGEGIAKDDFYIHWAGSLIADVSGRYEIVVHSTCAFELYLGEGNRKVIDNRVQSGDKTEFRYAVFLTGGRVYPIKLEFFQRKRKTEQPPAKVQLAWVPPAGSEHVIPSSQLIPSSMPSAFALQAKLPPDDRSYGYERGTAINRQWDESTTAAALEFADVAVKELWPRYQRKNRKGPDDDTEKLKAFLSEMVQTAFRAPLDDATFTAYVQTPVDQNESAPDAIKHSLVLTLKSPRFLYPLLDADRSPSSRVANRLALTLFDSLPVDAWVIDKATKNELTSEPAIREAAWRMVDDYRTRAKTRVMLYEWLGLSHMGDLTKDSKVFPDFDPALVSDLKRSLDAFLDDVVWSEPSDFRQLLQADWGFTTKRMADFYGDSWKPAENATSDEATSDEALVRSVSDQANRRGVLTHPLLMSHLAYHNATSPIHRGIFLVRHVLGRNLRPPNAAFSPLSPDLHPDLTTRERVNLQTSPESCQVCHSKINSLGFALENFDPVGRYRKLDRNKVVDASGSYITRDGDLAAFNGATEMADFLVRSDDTHRAFVAKAFEHFVKQPIAAYDPHLLDQLTDRFRESGFNIRGLLVEIAVIAASEPLKHADVQS